jgi:hypothetical protein
MTSSTAHNIKALRLPLSISASSKHIENGFMVRHELDLAFDTVNQNLQYALHCSRRFFK